MSSRQERDARRTARAQGKAAKAQTKAARAQKRAADAQKRATQAQQPAAPLAYHPVLDDDDPVEYPTPHWLPQQPGDRE